MLHPTNACKPLPVQHKLTELTVSHCHAVPPVTPDACLPGTGTVAPFFNKCVWAGRGSYAAGGPLDSETARIVACPSGTTTAGRGSTSEGDCSCK
jgi:hypothetical protein